MTEPALGCRHFFKRHSEAIFITAFIVADCFASGWVLTVGTLAALACVVVPAIRTMWSLTAADQITFLKAYVKTQKVQRLALLLFWIYSIRLVVYATTASLLFTGKGGQFISLSNALLFGAQELAPLAFLTTPIVFYAGACSIALLLRARLKATKEDPDLIRQRQTWSGACHILFMSAFVAGIICIAVRTDGPAFMLSNWFLTSARDANLFWDDPAKVASGSASSGTVSSATRVDASSAPSVDASSAPSVDASIDPGIVCATQTMSPAPDCPILRGADESGIFSNLSFVPPFDNFIITAFCSIVILLLLKPVLRLNAFLSSFCWRVVSPKSLQNVIEGFLEALRLPSRTLNFREAHPLLNNSGRTIAWLFACYAALFWLFGFCGGPLGLAIQNWMIAAGIEANLRGPSGAPAWMFEPSYRIFLGSIVALYGTAPFAVTATVFLPCVMSRKIVLNCDGILFAQGPYLTLWGRQFRLWSDLKSMTVKVKKSRSKSGMNAKFTLDFRSGGRVTFSDSQFSSQDLKVLLEGIDQYASSCSVDPQVYEVCRVLSETDQDRAASDGVADTAIAKIAGEEFKSTIFVPFSTGEILPGTQIRIIKKLATKPLCVVYLARDQDGRMVTVKQFYLADESAETKALAKILKREYELLSSLDHPGIAKVLNSFSIEKSTFLVIEHRLGSDIRAIVKEYGARSESLTIAWAKQLCEIMIYLHTQEPPITHRDLTPDNVIAGEDGQLRLIDFGAAREFLEGITGTMLGKHCYVSPEQLRGEANRQSDIYSFGATLYFWLTGRDPIALSQSSPGELVDCSKELDQLIRDCTEFEEDKRPQSFEEILNRLNDMDTGFRLKFSAAKEKVKV